MYGTSCVSSVANVHNTCTMYTYINVRDARVHIYMYICTHAPGHPSAVGEAWYWPKHVLLILGDCLTSRPKGLSRPRELWFSIYSCTCTCHRCRNSFETGGLLQYVTFTIQKLLQGTVLNSSNDKGELHTRQPAFSF